MDIFHIVFTFSGILTFIPEHYLFETIFLIG